MPIAFLAPVFLAGLAAIAIPILIHLSNRPRKEVVRFPSLMFLERVEFQSSSRRRLRHLGLLALRILALLLLAGAFARPFLDRPVAAPSTPEGGREVVVLLDRSGSMAIGDRLERAREAVGTVADGLRRGDRATLVAFGTDAEAVNRATDQPAALRAAAAGVEAGHGATRLAPALRLAESTLSGSPLPRRELVIIGDFQTSGWDGSAEIRMPAGTEVRTVDVGEPVANTFVADARFDRERFAGRDRVTVSATVAVRPAEAGSSGAPADPAAAADAPARVPVELMADGRVVDRAEAELIDGVATVRFQPLTLPDAGVRGAVRVPGDALAADDALHFVLSSRRAFRVLHAAGPGEAPYLARALEVGPSHEVATVPAARLADAELGGVDVVVVTGDPGPGGSERLAGFADAGGGVVVVLGSRTRAGSWADAGLLPGSPDRTRDAGAGVALGTFREDHPVFRSFADRSGGLSGARFFRYREVDPSDAAEVLARFENGAPAVLAAGRGGGRVLMLTSSVDGDWNDLVLRPAFVPLVHGLVRYASGRVAVPAWRTVGELLEVDALAAPAGRSDQGDGGTVLLTPSDEAVEAEPGALVRLEEPGIYQLRDPAAGMVVGVAVNMDRSESEPGRTDPDAVRLAVQGDPIAPVAASFAPEDRERRQSLWWYVLAAGFVVMALETALSNGLSRRALPRVQKTEER